MSLIRQAMIFAILGAMFLGIVAVNAQANFVEQKSDQPPVRLVHMGVYWLKCLGDIEGPRWLDGRTGDGSVGLAPSTDYPYTGTKWQAFLSGGPVAEKTEISNKIWHFKCLGDIEGPRWLNGRIGDASVGLAPSPAVFTTNPNQGTRWWVTEVEPGIYNLRCLEVGDFEKPRMLDGRTGDGSVGLAPSTDYPYTGTKWQAIAAQ
jgi:hypothetical protein